MGNAAAATVHLFAPRLEALIRLGSHAVRAGECVLHLSADSSDSVLARYRTQLGNRPPNLIVERQTDLTLDCLRETVMERVLRSSGVPDVVICDHLQASLADVVAFERDTGCLCVIGSYVDTGATDGHQCA